MAMSTGKESSDQAEAVLYGRLGDRHPGPIADPRLDRVWSAKEVTGLGIEEHGYFAGIESRWSGSENWAVKASFLPEAWIRGQYWAETADYDPLLDRIERQYSSPERLYICEPGAEGDDPGPGLTNFRSVEDIGARPALFSAPSVQLRAVEELAATAGEWRWLRPRILPSSEFPKVGGFPGKYQISTRSARSSLNDADIYPGMLLYIAGEGRFPIQGAVKTETFQIARLLIEALQEKEPLS